MRTLNKVLQIAKIHNEDLELTLSKFLFQYRTTPHSTIKVAPAELLFNRKINGNVPCIKRGVINKHRLAKENEEKSKQYNKFYADMNRKWAQQDINVGDMVLLKHQRKNKLMTRYCPEPCHVINVMGSDVTVVTQGRKYVCRNKSFFKKIGGKTGTREDEEEEDEMDTYENNAVALPENQHIVGRNTLDVTEGVEDEEPSNGFENIRRSNRQRFQID